MLSNRVRSFILNVNEKTLPLRKSIILCGCVIGIFVCSAIFGLLQEQIFRERYGDEDEGDGTVGERYTMPITFGAAQCIFSVLLAKGLFEVIRYDSNVVHKLCATIVGSRQFFVLTMC